MPNLAAAAVARVGPAHLGFWCIYRNLHRGDGPMSRTSVAQPSQDRYPERRFVRIDTRGLACFDDGMPRLQFSLRRLLGAIAAVAYAAGAFVAPLSVVSGFLAMVLGTCSPGLLVVVWRSGTGYRRSFVLGAITPSVIGAYRSLRPLASLPYLGPLERNATNPDMNDPSVVLFFAALALGGGLTGMAMHWFLSGNGPDASSQPSTPR